MSLYGVLKWMKRTHFEEGLLAFCAAGVLTGVLYYFSSQVSYKNQAEDALALARTTYFEVTSLAKYAQEQGEATPVYWAIGKLFWPERTPAGVTRALKVFPVELPNDFGAKTQGEKFEWNAEGGYFDFVRTVGEEGSNYGVRVQIARAYRGAFGLRDRLRESVAVTTLACFFFLCFWMGLRYQRVSRAVRRKELVEWVENARRGIKDLGVCIRDVVGDCKQLIVASIETQETLERMASSLLAVEAELERTQIALARTIATSERFAKGARALPAPIQTHIRALLDEMAQTRQSLQQAAEQLQPAAQAMDEARRRTGKVLQFRGGMQEHLVKATGALNEHVDKVKKLNRFVS
ncbi:MAG: hypothetical protein AB7P04_12580 [Bacteriovoracia bacterium]